MVIYISSAVLFMLGIVVGSKMRILAIRVRNSFFNLKINAQIIFYFSTFSQITLGWYVC